MTKQFTRTHESFIALEQMYSAQFVQSAVRWLQQNSNTIKHIETDMELSDAEWNEFLKAVAEHCPNLETLRLSTLKEIPKQFLPTIFTIKSNLKNIALPQIRDPNAVLLCLFSRKPGNLEEVVLRLTENSSPHYARETLKHLSRIYSRNPGVTRGDFSGMAVLPFLPQFIRKEPFTMVMSTSDFALGKIASGWGFGSQLDTDRYSSEYARPDKNYWKNIVRDSISGNYKEYTLGLLGSFLRVNSDNVKLEIKGGHKSFEVGALSHFIDFIRDNQSIVSLDLSGINFTREQLLKLLPAIPNVKYLNLSECGIESVALEGKTLLEDLVKRNPNLEELVLSGNHIHCVDYKEGFFEWFLPTKVYDLEFYRPEGFWNAVGEHRKLSKVDISKGPNNSICCSSSFHGSGMVTKRKHLTPLTIRYSGNRGEVYDLVIDIPKAEPEYLEFLGSSAPAELAAGSASMGAESSASAATSSPLASDEKQTLAAKENEAISNFQASQIATAAVAAASTVGAERLIEDIELPPSYQHAISEREAARRAAEATRVEALVDAFMDMPQSSPTTEVLLVLPEPSAPPLPTALITASQSDAAVVMAVAPTPVPAPRPRTQTMVERFVMNPLTNILGSPELNVPSYIVTRNGTRIDLDGEGNPVVPEHIPTVDEIRQGATQRATPAAPAQTGSRATAN